MRGSEVFPSSYLKAEELDGDLDVTIASVDLVTLGQGKEAEQKPIAHFEELEKGLVLNKTNWSLIAKQHGDESDEWVGKKITLCVMDVEFKGDLVQAIRVKPQRKPLLKPGLKVTPKPAQRQADDAAEPTPF